MAQNNEAYYIIVCGLRGHADTLAGSRPKAWALPLPSRLGVSVGKTAGVGGHILTR